MRKEDNKLNDRTGSIKQTEQAILGIYLYSYTHMHVMTIDEKRDHLFERELGNIWEGLDAGKVRGKL